MKQPSLRVPSFANINWRLRILGKRTECYHELSTQQQTISLHDDLEFELTEDGVVSLECDDAEIPTDDRNLVVRAARQLRKRNDVAAGVHVRLKKRIPAKAGLGGASSNAAVTLLALAHLWKLAPAENELHEIAGELGADVPFFLHGGCTLATGIGSEVSPLPDNSDGQTEQLIVLKPNASVSTADAYAGVDARALTTPDTDPILSSSRAESVLRNSQPWLARDSLQNDFESVIFDIEPEIKRTKEALLQAGALNALLAGSGSCVFGIFAGKEDQQRALEKLEIEAGWRVFPCVTVSRD